MGHLRQLLRTLGPAAVNPLLLTRLARAGWRFRARDWYRHPPFLPLPPVNYLEWRMHTAYGDDAVGPTRAELERYLRWASDMSNVHKSGS